jgi:hypothetical protein
MQIQRPGNDMTGRHHRAQRECLVSVEKRGAVVKRLENQKLSLLIIVKHYSSAGGHLFVRSSGCHEKKRVERTFPRPRIPIRSLLKYFSLLSCPRHGTALALHYFRPPVHHTLLPHFTRMALRQLVRATAPKLGLQSSIPALSTSIARNYSTGEVFACLARPLVDLRAYLAFPSAFLRPTSANLPYPPPRPSDILHLSPFIALRSHRGLEIHAVSRGTHTNHGQETFQLFLFLPQHKKQASQRFSVRPSAHSSDAMIFFLYSCKIS